jgi:hypothetical protein
MSDKEDDDECAFCILLPGGLWMGAGVNDRIGTNDTIMSMISMSIVDTADIILVQEDEVEKKSNLKNLMVVVKVTV